MVEQNLQKQTKKKNRKVVNRVTPEFPQNADLAELPPLIVTIAEVKIIGQTQI